MVSISVLLVVVLAAGAASTQTPGSATEQNVTTGQPAANLPPIVRAILAEALVKEEEIKRRGAMGVTWPYALPLCLSEKRPCGVAFPLPICLFEHGLCGAVNRDGSIAVAPRFDFVDEFHEGRALVRLGGLYGFVDLNGKVVVEPQYALAGRYRLGHAEVDIDGKSALIDREGRQVLEPRFARAGAFTKGVFWVNDGVRDYRGPAAGAIFAAVEVNSGLSQYVFARAGRWGLVDAAGTWIRRPEFTDIAIFDPENRDLMWAKADTGWGLIRPDGTWLVEPTFESVGELVDDRAPVWIGRRIGYVDRTGRIVIPPKFDDGILLTHFVDGMPSPAKLGQHFGLIDRSGDWVVEPAYDRISPIYRGAAAPPSDLEFKGFFAGRGEKSDILDQSGKVIIEGMRLRPSTSTSRTTSSGGMIFTSTMGQFPMFCADGRIIGFVDQKPQLFDRDGTPLAPSQGEMWWPLTCDAPYVLKLGERFVHVDKWLRKLTAETFEAVGPFHHGLAAVRLDGKYGLIRADGSWAIEPKFDAVQPFQNDLVLAKMDGQAGLVSVASGAWVTHTRFDDVCSLRRGIVGVMLDGQMGAIDENGHWLFEPNYEPWAFNVFQDLIQVRSRGKWGFLDAAGNSIEAKFDEVRRFERGVAWGKTGDTWCPIDRRGNKVPALTCQSVDPNPMQRPWPDAIMPCRIPPLAHAQQ
jgi:hypothetical protein